jgi:hypothetical protein
MSCLVQWKQKHGTKEDNTEHKFKKRVKLHYKVHKMRLGPSSVSIPWDISYHMRLL